MKENEAEELSLSKNVVEGDVLCKKGQYLDLADFSLCYNTPPENKLKYDTHNKYGRVTVTEEECIKTLGNVILEEEKECMKKCPEGYLLDTEKSKCQKECGPE